VGCSVIIPVHNRAQLIGRAIRSVMAQSYQDWELIVVDDGSTDQTGAAVAELVSERVRYVRKEVNSGAAASRNHGVALARHSLITFLDSDDEVAPDWLEKMLAERERSGAEVVCCGLSEYDASGNLKVTLLPRDLGPMFDHCVGRFTRGSDYLLPKTLFLAVGGFDASLPSGQHTELAMRLVPHLKQHGLKVANVFAPLVRVNIHTGARIRTNWRAMRDGHAKVVSKHRQLFEKDRRLMANYLSIAGVCSVRTKEFEQAKRHFRVALVADPWRPVRWARFLASQVPGLRSRLWR
jgi:glycosyltransferase involved in cell wall biosynthesis